MKKPTHFDLEEVATQMRESFKRINAMVPPDLSDDARILVNIQSGLQEAQISFMIEEYRAINSGIGPDIVGEAFGAVMGDIIARFISSTADPRISGINVMRSIIRSISNFSGDVDDGVESIRDDAHITPIVGGNA